MVSQQQHFDAARRFQEYYSEATRDVGVRIPEPVLGQSVNDYRRETLRHLKREFLPKNHPLYEVQFRGLATDALEVFEPQLLKAVPQERLNPNTVAPGELRMITKRDPNNGQEIRTFIGPRHFTWDMTRVRGRTTLKEMQKRADILRMAK
jgi:hypothetical protein